MLGSEEWGGQQFFGKNPSHEPWEYWSFSCHSCKRFWKGGFHKVFVLWFRRARPVSRVRRAGCWRNIFHSLRVCQLLLFLTVGDTLWAYDIHICSSSTYFPCSISISHPCAKASHGPGCWRHAGARTPWRWLFSSDGFGSSVKHHVYALGVFHSYRESPFIVDLPISDRDFP